MARSTTRATDSTLLDRLTPESLTRREFLVGAGKIGLSTAFLPVFLQACRSSSAPVLDAVTKPDISPETVKIQHLLRRAGFGASQAELDRFISMGLVSTTDYLIEYDKTDDSDLENRLAALNIDRQRLADLQRWWLVRMVYTKRPLQEKMVLFWHGLLTSASSKVNNVSYLLAQNQLFRDQALGNYDALLKAVAKDPAMLIWLDNRRNVKRAPNENFARELMELFTMGIGHYTESDVRESARAFTGWGLKGDDFNFDPSQHDSGTKTFLGQIGNFDGDDIIDIIMQQPAASEFISRKLFEFFAYDNPEQEVVSRLAGTFASNSYNIKAVVREILTSDEFFSDRAYRAKLKSPAELVAGMVRTLGINAVTGSEMVKPTSDMGQALFNPPDVSGWDGGATWINSTTLLNRVNFANQAASARNRNFGWDPARLLAQSGGNTPEVTVDYFISLLLDGNMPSSERDVLVRYMSALQALPSTPAPAPERSAADDRLRSLVYLVLASPDYQLA